jgi:hypothetical protein
MKGTREAIFTQGGAVIDPGRLFSPGGFKGDGSPFVHGRNVGGFAGSTEIGGDGAPSYSLFNDDVRPGAQRNILTILAHYDLDSRFRPYVDLHLSEVRNTSTSQQTQLVNQPIARDNAYLPANVAALAPASGTFINRWDYDGGLIDLAVAKRTLRAVVGAKGDLTPHLQYDLSLNYGQVRTRSATANTRLYDRYLAAMDAVVDPSSGRIVCRSTIDPSSFNRLKTDSLAVAFNPALGPVSFSAGPNSGCVPYNPFTTNAAANTQALAWIYQPTVDFVRNSQTVLSGYLAADTGQVFNLPGGPVRLVAGAEYRREDSCGGFRTAVGLQPQDHQRQQCRPQGRLRRFRTVRRSLLAPAEGLRAPGPRVRRRRSLPLLELFDDRPHSDLEAGRRVRHRGRSQVPGDLVEGGARADHRRAVHACRRDRRDHRHQRPLRHGQRQPGHSDQAGQLRDRPEGPWR